MMAKENPFVRGHKIAAIVVALAGSSARVIECENFGRDEGGVEPVRHQKAADRRDNKPRRIERLAAIECNLAERSRAKQDDSEPNDDAE
jgi:hypothetical protein